MRTRWWDAAVLAAGHIGFALGAMALSWLFLATGRRNVANFIGQWVPTVLIMGLYNKTVKQHGSE